MKRVFRIIYRLKGTHYNTCYSTVASTEEEAISDMKEDMKEGFSQVMIDEVLTARFVI
jgi:hypothetical protein